MENEISKEVEVMSDFQVRKMNCEKEIQPILEKYNMALDARMTQHIVFVDVKPEEVPQGVELQAKPEKEDAKKEEK